MHYLILVLSLIFNIELYSQNYSTQKVAQIISYEVKLYNNFNDTTYPGKSIISSKEYSQFINYFSNPVSFESVIILDSTNARISDTVQFHNSCFSNDTILVTNSNNEEEQIILQLNYLGNSKDFRIIFYESWEIDNITMNIKKEVLAYTLRSKFQKLEENYDLILFTVVNGINSLELLQKNGYFLGKK